MVFGLNCPSCGGRVEIDEGDKLVICPFCNTVSLVKGDDEVKTLAYKLQINEKTAMNSAHRWFRHGFKARDLKKESKVTEIYHIYLPFWKYTAKGLGIVCGYNLTTDAQGNRHKEYKEKQIIKDYTWSKIACDAGDIGITHLRNYNGTVTLLPEDTATFEATTSKDMAVELGEEEIKKLIEKDAKIENITFQKSFVVPKNFTLLYYPFWVIRYEYKGKMYFLTVDGVTGKVVSGRAPGDSLWQALAIGTGATFSGILTGLAVPGALYINIRLGILLFIAGIMIFLWAYSFFRHGSEIVEGDLEKPYKERFALKGVKIWK